MMRSSGCHVWDDTGPGIHRLHHGPGLGRPGLCPPRGDAGGHRAAGNGVVGPLAPVLEEEVAGEICRLIPWIEQVRFLKTGAEAMAAAVRLARVFTGRDQCWAAAITAGSTGLRVLPAFLQPPAPCTPSFPSTMPTVRGS